MIKILWFLHRPEVDVEGFEDWYQNEHVPIGMRQERLRAFRINRSLYPQPAFVVRETGSQMPRAYRFSEGYWPSMDDVRVCYSSPEGRAAIGHGPLNIGPSTPATPRPTLFIEEEDLPVPTRLDFDIRAGAYRAPDACKLFGIFRMGGQAGAWDTKIRELVKAAVGHPDLRGLVLGRGLPEVVKLGRIAQLPAVGAEVFDRTFEVYFESPAALDRFCASPAMQAIAQAAKARAEAVVWDACRIQEIFFTTLGRQPLEQSWLDLYARD